jgi:hypothetical protein
MSGKIKIPPRLIRFRDAPSYLGMDRSAFNKLVRPHVTEAPLGKQGIVFDTLELNSWADDYMHRNGRPGNRSDKWQKQAKRQGLPKSVKSGISTKESEADAYAKAREQAISEKQKPTSQGGSKKYAKRKSMVKGR